MISFFAAIAKAGLPQGEAAILQCSLLKTPVFEGDGLQPVR
jgi:hypothetical protein